MRPLNSDNRDSVRQRSPLPRPLLLGRRCMTVAVGSGGSVKAAAETIEGNSDRHPSLTPPIGPLMRQCAGVSCAKADWQGNTPFLASQGNSILTGCSLGPGLPQCSKEPHGLQTSNRCRGPQPQKKHPNQRMPFFRTCVVRRSADLNLPHLPSAPSPYPGLAPVSWRGEFLG